MVTMNDLQKTREYLQMALKSLPAKDKNTTIKNMINKTITEIEAVQKKAKNTLKNVKNYEKEWQEKMEKVAMDLKNPQASLDAIEKMIEAETEKMQNSKTQDKKDSNLKIILD
jgi:deoxyribodipyrimidine photolyase